MLCRGDYLSCTTANHKADHSYRIEEGRTKPFAGETKALQAGKIAEAPRMQKPATFVLDCTNADHY